VSGPDTARLPQHDKSTPGIVIWQPARRPLRGRQQANVTCIGHLGWRNGRHLIAAEGGADRRSAKNADAPIYQSREALLAARPLHSPEGGRAGQMTLIIDRRGTHPQGVGNDVGVDVPIAVGVAGNHRPGARGSPVGGAGLRSLPAKQHAPKARSTTNHDEWPAGVVPGRPSSTNDLTAWTCAAAECRTFALDRRASRPSCTTKPPGEQAAARPGGSPPPDPLLGTTGSSRACHAGAGDRAGGGG
jgi:hypothetical protein